MIVIKRYGSRHWAVYVNDNLLCVTLYKKGADAVKHALERAATRAPA